MNENPFLILVDDGDRQWGKLEKTLVHELGLLHRAFSVFIFNSDGDLLLQQRADEKYHSGGLWTNTCCSHPRWGESLEDAVEERLFAEMGITAETNYAFNFIYKVEFGNGLTEHELDHVFIGTSDVIPNPNPAEVKNWKYCSMNYIRQDMRKHPERYTVWFRLCFEQVAAYGDNQIQLINKRA